ncbi:hypothetical protein [Virgibacillus salexigens]|uniref:DUF4829 domain-containing protein n=1 Tax=Virgibacillus kapii TaxID=1638645 RepID=A0ABQ2DSM8_9BACI|nr:hypothetical protein [Virgibacillus kapii]GGJ67627.1 hypothetical protein GCM10007111_31880 [Virgibacillus kapii]
MKKMLAAVVVLFLSGGYLFLENMNLKNEKSHLQAVMGEMEGFQDESIIHGEAGESARHFVEGYFIYENKPNQEDVEPYAEPQVLDKLQFNEPMQSDDNIKVVYSDVSDVNIYHGQATDNQQETVVLFNNEILVDGIESTTFTVMVLDMSLNDGDWKVKDFDFYQL